MILGRILSNIQTAKVDRTQADKYKEMQSANKALLDSSMSELGQEALANTAKGSFQAMQNLQELNRMLQEQVKKNKEE